MARVMTSDDAGRVLDDARRMLERDPVANNLVLARLEQASRSEVAGTFWLVCEARRAPSRCGGPRRWRCCGTRYCTSAPRAEMLAW
jgi:hypothetical protein